MNLSLRVLGKRSDGYHEIDTLMFAVSLYDELRVTAEQGRAGGVTCRVRGPERVAGGAENLAARAATAVLEHLGVRARVSIDLTKNIPFGAGLGGGSSDAAAVVRVLPALVGRRLDPVSAATIARSLGADVPFFLACRPSRATGIGEILRPLARPPAGTLLIAVPAERVATAWAYAKALPRLTSAPSAFRVRPLPRSIDAVEAWFFNDFQRGVEAAFPSVRHAREALEAVGARRAVMSGSGCAVAGLFRTAAGARSAAAAYRGPGKLYVATMLRGAPRPGRRGMADEA